MDKLDIQEKIWGGIFGVIAVIAAIAEMLANGVSTSSVFGMVKDVAGTLVVVVVMVAVARLIVPKKSSLSLEDRLNKALEDWKNENSNMIVKSDAIDGKSKGDSSTRYYGLGMKTDMNNFYSEISLSTQAGWFVRLPVINAENYARENIEINFHLNKETFFGRASSLSDDEIYRRLNELSNKFAEYINRRFVGFAKAVGKKDTLKVILQNPVVHDEDIERLVSLINTTYTAFLVSSQIRV